MNQIDTSLTNGPQQIVSNRVGQDAIVLLLFVADVVNAGLMAYLIIGEFLAWAR